MRKSELMLIKSIIDYFLNSNPTIQCSPKAMTPNKNEYKEYRLKIPKQQCKIVRQEEIVRHLLLQKKCVVNVLFFPLAYTETIVSIGFSSSTVLALKQMYAFREIQR